MVKFNYYFCLSTSFSFNFQVHLSFLYVGHTHEDIDAAFSKVAEKLRKQEAETLHGLMSLLPNAKQTSGLYDIKNWFLKIFKSN